jgi:hypothetical protein
VRLCRHAECEPAAASATVGATIVFASVWFGRRCPVSAGGCMHTQQPPERGAAGGSVIDSSSSLRVRRVSNPHGAREESGTIDCCLLPHGPDGRRRISSRLGEKGTRS